MNPESGRPTVLLKAAHITLVFATLMVAVNLVFGRRMGQATEDQVRFLSAVAAGLCFVSLFLYFLVHDLRRKVLVMEELLEDVRFGAGTRRDRDAVDILIRALRTPDENVRETALRTLRKLSGQDLGKFPEAWETWWKVARATFTRAAAPGPEAAARK